MVRVNGCWGHLIALYANQGHTDDRVELIPGLHGDVIDDAPKKILDPRGIVACECRGQLDSKVLYLVERGPLQFGDFV